MKFRMRDYGEVLVTRDQGEPVRAELLKAMESHSTVEGELDGVDSYTPSFMDEVSGKALLAVGAARFRRQVILRATEVDVKRLVKLVLSNRSKQCAQAP